MSITGKKYLNILFIKCLKIGRFIIETTSSSKNEN